MESERLSVAKGAGHSESVCPRCKCRSYYDLRPQVAWCFASGQIEFGDEGAVPNGGIVIARGEKSSLKGVVAVLARQSRGLPSALIVPGVPEASDQKAASNALAIWLKWCTKGNGQKGRHGVVFETEKAGQ